LKHEKNINSKIKKGFISKKNLPTYKKYWESYCFEKLKDELNLQINIELNESFKYMMNELKNEQIKISKTPDIFVSQLLKNISDKNRSKSFSQKLINRKFNLNNKNIEINHTSAKINKNLKSLLIDNIKTQYSLNPSINTIKTSVSDDIDYIEINFEINNKTDIETVKNLLNNL